MLIFTRSVIFNPNSRKPISAQDVKAENTKRRKTRILFVELVEFALLEEDDHVPVVGFDVPKLLLEVGKILVRCSGNQECPTIISLLI